MYIENLPKKKANIKRLFKKGLKILYMEAAGKLQALFYSDASFKNKTF